MELSPVGLLLVLMLCSYSEHAAGQGTSKAVLVLDPVQTQFYTGESVTLRCSIEGQGTSGWKFSWYRDGSHVYPPEVWSDKNGYAIQTLHESHSGDYTCIGLKNNIEYSKRSEKVKLQVSALPTARVTVKPDTPVFTGEEVTLKCEIEPESVWTYKWFKGSSSGHLSQPDTSTLTIRAAAKFDENHYWCQGEIRGRAVSSHMSGSVYVFVKERPKAAVTLTPASRDVFRGDSVTLRCDIPEGRNTDWDYSWYFNRNPFSPVASSQEHSISSAEYHHSGDYTCRGVQRRTTQSSDISDLVTLTVSERPKAVVFLSPSWSPVFSGESVTLTCSIQGESPSDWRHSWYRGGQQVHPQRGWSASNEYRLQSVQEAHRGVYSCQGSRRRDERVSSKSDDLTLTVSKRTKAAVTLTPVTASRDVFRGDSVTLRCDIPEGRNTDWDYSWYFNRYPISPVASSQEHSISSAEYHHSGDYTCRGVQRRTTQSSDISDLVTLTVSARPAATLTVTPQSPVFTGESVTLSCDIKSYSGWTYKWFKDKSNKVVSTGSTFTLKEVSESHCGEYWCQGERRERPTSSQSSSKTTIEVKAPKPKLTLSPGHQLSTGESVTLRCELGVPSGLVFYWYRHTQTSDPVAQTDGNSYNISSGKVSDGGQYWCRAGRGDPILIYTQYSDVAEIKFTDGDVILESPVHPVTEGDPLTLHCRYRHQPSNISADFYKDGTHLQTSTKGEMTIPAVSKSHEGLYKCRNPERGESPESWVTVRVSDAGSSMLVVAVGVVMGLLVAFALVISLVLLHRSFKVKDSGSGTMKRNPDQKHQTTEHNSDPDQRTNQISDQDQRTNQSSKQDQSQSAGRQGAQSEYMPLQKRCTDDYETLTPLYMPLQKGATDVYETIKSSKDYQEDYEEGYDDVDVTDI
ncbi:Fc receptor-like protein 5 isoform X3 [Alosa sapidissima]|uniref:Fc receptor-like protein 5 isoform X3 n=1 Tax=Alosa sapidissima TaxID=34773 RepID=UPI001C0994C6|nr:Fc receptor-like protein 5 isoform X3 [Alosa sapidissima]